MLTTAVLLAASMAIGQEEARPSNYQHLEGLECFIGEWTTEGKMPNEAKEKAGESFKGRTSAKWVVGRNVQEWHWRVRIARKVFYEGKSFYYYDAATQQIKSFNVGLRGGHWTGILTRQDGKWIETMTGVNPEGKKTLGTGTYMADGDTMTLEFTEQKIGDEPEPDVTIEYKRAKPKKKQKK